MKILGLEISFGRKKPVSQEKAADSWPVSQADNWGSGSWGWPAIRESFTGAWQRGIIARPETVLNYHAVYSCVTLIASDIGKLRVKLVEQGPGGIWSETTSPAFSPVLTKPNRYQTRIQFLQQWVTSKLTHGNTYVLKERDNRGVVIALYVLDPNRVKPLVTPDGGVYYQLGVDWLSGIPEARPGVPASEIIHDTMNALFHPLVGISPIYACGLAATQGLSIQRNSTAFFGNGARPGGILTAPGRIDNDTAARLKEHWQANFTGENAGNVAVLGDGLTYQAAIMSAVDAQLIDQLKMTAQMVCSAFHIPEWMIGLAALPAGVAVEAMTQQYYTQCLQILIESIELCLDEGLGLVNTTGHTYGTELDLDGLLRMDAEAQYKAIGEAIHKTLMTPNEGRKKLDLPPVEGGASLFIQEQNYSVAAIAKRDALDNPFGAKSPEKTPAQPPAPPMPEPTKAVNDDLPKDLAGDLMAIEVRKQLGLLA